MINEPLALEPHLQTLPQECRALLWLWAAVFELGVADAYATYRAAPTTKLGWLTSNYTGPGSFSWICSLFGVDPGMARQRILARFAAKHKTGSSNADTATLAG